MLFAFLTVEVMLARGELDAKAVRMLARVDLWYAGRRGRGAGDRACARDLGRQGLGLLRRGTGCSGRRCSSFAARGARFRSAPTRAFLRWRRRAAREPAFAVPEDERKRMRRYLMWEVHVAALIPLLAVIMSRGLAR